MEGFLVWWAPYLVKMIRAPQEALSAAGVPGRPGALTQAVTLIPVNFPGEAVV